MSNALAQKFDRLAGRSTPGALARWVRLALPQCCALCAAPAGEALLCASCERALPRIRQACPRCALPSPGAALCGACLARPPPFASAVAAFQYAFPVDRLLQRFKYGGALALGEWAAGALAETLRSHAATTADVVVALPLAALRQRERGFNQAQEVARGLARRLALPLGAHLERTRSAPPQAALPWSGRAANVRRAFVCRENVRGRNVAIVDDVMTTGATLAEAARTLITAGAASVAVWVVARTLPPGDG